jgi:hypothetical protein
MGNDQWHVVGKGEKPIVNVLQYVCAIRRESRQPAPIS